MAMGILQYLSVANTLEIPRWVHYFLPTYLFT